jgi:serine/threonine protein kinase
MDEGTKIKMASGTEITVGRLRRAGQNYVYVYEGLWGSVDIAIKHLALSSQNKKAESQAKQFDKEINVLSKLTHPGVIKYYDCFRSDTR